MWSVVLSCMCLLFVKEFKDEFKRHQLSASDIKRQFTPLMSFQTCVTYFLLWYPDGEILKNVFQCNNIELGLELLSFKKNAKAP